MDYGIKGRVALVVGGSAGIGFEVAQILADEGCPVAVAARTKANVDVAVERIRERGGTAVGVAADISRRFDVVRAVDEVRRELGAPLIVIGQTKYQKPGDFADFIEPDVLRESFEAYTVSQFLLLQAVLPGMKDAGWGRFVHIGSGTAKEPTGNIHHLVANATRPSTIGLLKTVADEYARYGITVNTVAPGWIETDNSVNYMRDNLGLTTEEQRTEWLLVHGGVPAGRMGRPTEIASSIAYLCSEAAGYMTGNLIAVDGGLHRAAF